MFIPSVNLPFWALILIFLLVLPAASSLGFRFGRLELRRLEARGLTASYSGDTTLGALLALLGLLLGFTFSATLGWRESSATLVVEEAAAISTAFLRADLLPGDTGRPLQEALLDYARSRVIPTGFSKPPLNSETILTTTLAEQVRLWPALLQALGPDVPVNLQTYLSAGVTDVLDAHTRRLAAAAKTVSASVWSLLFFAAGSGAFLLGNRAGLQGRAPTWRTLLFSIVLSGVLITIADLDRPSNGFSTVPQTSLADAVKDMEAALHPAAEAARDLAARP
ncbi:hypothetical protein [Pseudooceanicola sp. HF7]|uniref:bestrophin-like domain n=1 Tax=Pseudooceanicola sp. HF7 TaxID=2721560 RepID=UPI001430B7AE|nr:hypothetical protein [Pseudooceanicola sp. HF7]NIZ07884.1 hypothetical protein [Pseudooceanicola sp. HF7]